MYSFTNEKTKTGIPVAMTTDGKMLYLDEYKNTTKKLKKEFTKDVNVLDFEELFQDYKGNKKQQIMNEVHLLLTDPDAIKYIKNPNSLSIYRAIRAETKELGKPITEVKIDDGQFSIFPNPNPKVFETLFICGQSGSGKSTVCLHYCQHYKKLFPKNDIYLVSSLDKDETLDKLKSIIRLDINTFITDPPSIDEFENSLVVFDDFETLEHTDKKLYKAITALMSQLISKGRHKNCRSVVIRHRFQNSGDKTGQLLISEATKYIVYPKTCSQANLKLLFGTHGAMSNKQIQMLYTMPTRWICYNKGFPNYCLTENEAFLIHK
jgi:hypothetical protein